jgi:hypothetical protein
MGDREEEDEGERSILFEIAGDEDMKVYLMSWISYPDMGWN